MNREQELRAKLHARSAALCDVSFDREPSKERAAWTSNGLEEP
jgi:hypothetical protein